MVVEHPARHGTMTLAELAAEQIDPKGVRRIPCLPDDR
jgi:hypothetical protein